MNAMEYKEAKHFALQQSGANDKESLLHFAEKSIKIVSRVRNIVIFATILMIPLCFIFIGIPGVIIGLCISTYFQLGPVKKAKKFKESIMSDPEFQ